MGKVKTPTLPPVELVKSQSKACIGNVDASTTGGEYKDIKDYSFDLNFVLLHLYTLASAGSMFLIVVLILVVSQLVFCGGAG